MVCRYVTFILLESAERIALLQALIFIIKREFMLVGWMIVYLISSVMLFEIQNFSDVRV